MKPIFKLALAAALFCEGGLYSAAAAGRVAAPYLKLPLGTRATGMGEAFTGVANDEAALYYNAAGIAQIEATLASFMHLQGFGGINYEYLGIVSPLENLGIDVWGSIGITYELIGIEPIKRTKADALGNYDQAYADRNFTYTAGGTLVGLSYAWQATKLFSLGGTAKFINQKVDDADGWGYAADIALFTKPDAIPGLGAGLVIQNAGVSPDKSAPLPVNLRVGAAYTFDAPFSKPDKPLDKLVLSSDLVLPIVPIDAATAFAAGLEYSRWFGSNQFALRTGYRFPRDLGPISGLTAGFGYGIEFPGTMLNLDYAFVPYGDLGMSHRVSLSGTFGMSKPASPAGARPEEFGPPTNVQVTGGDRRAQLSWTAPKAKVAGYNIYMTYNPASGKWYKLNRAPVQGTAQGVGGLYNNVPLYFGVTAIQTLPAPRESGKSQPVSVILRPGGTIGTPAPPMPFPGQPKTQARPQTKPAAPAGPPPLP